MTPDKAYCIPLNDHSWTVLNKPRREQVFHQALTLSPTPGAPLGHRHPAQRGTQLRPFCDLGPASKGNTAPIHHAAYLFTAPTGCALLLSLRRPRRAMSRPPRPTYSVCWIWSSENSPSRDCLESLGGRDGGLRSVLWRAGDTPRICQTVNGVASARIFPVLQGKDVPGFTASGRSSMPFSTCSRAAVLGACCRRTSRLGRPSTTGSGSGVSTGLGSV